MEKTISSIPGLYGFKLKVLCTPLNPMDDFDDDDCGQCKVIDALYTGDTINKGVGAVYPKGTITTQAETGTPGHSAIGGRMATSGEFYGAYDVSVAPNGDLYIEHSGNY